ncbi:hypothetical protein [Fundidesulfovibrio terrae]|uniref:hypothetical protein n=1 Tax=Fundidesulfovibrio terrae TaxID=2922866 RepID=UPI001FAEF901|nr:hypothetical protein [Fundidesulfovibrio terrae]
MEFLVELVALRGKVKKTERDENGSDNRNEAEVDYDRNGRFSCWHCAKRVRYNVMKSVDGQQRTLIEI